LRGSLTKRWNLPHDMQVVAGTTDSTAGFIAAGADLTGTAVTALGSTLVIKVLSDQPVFAAHDGVYSHRLGERWLVGGASNAGGATLLKFFNRCDIRRYTRLIKPEQATGLDYYPLPATGERFPLLDPGLQPRLEPRPPSDAVFFQAILEGLAAIEQRGYRLLAERGAPYPQKVLTVGGGAANAAWMQIRERCLAVPVTRAAQQEAAFGAALLARGL
jgi:sugar (pentulose or hexulose) kinase